MKVLEFDRAGRGRGRIRTSRFVDRSLYPIAAACVVAAGIRETLSELTALPVSLHLFEPAMPSKSAWDAILDGALTYAYRGPVTDAAIVLRAPDARTIASAAFGELGSKGCLPLSVLERGALERIVNAMSRSLSALCGGAVERGGAATGWSSYVELLVERPMEAAIGIALASEPAWQPGPGRDLADLADLPLNVAVELIAGAATAESIATLAPGVILPVAADCGLRGRLVASGRTLWSGRCGVRGGRYAFELEGAIGERGATI